MAQIKCKRGNAAANADDFININVVPKREFGCISPLKTNHEIDGVLTVFQEKPLHIPLIMEDADNVAEDENSPRRSSRIALIEINETVVRTDAPSPDEMVIIQRGPRRKPITWSPVDYEKVGLLVPTRDKTPEPGASTSPRRELNPKIRRRLVMNPGGKTSTDLGEVIAKKLRTLKTLERCTR